MKALGLFITLVMAVAVLLIIAEFLSMLLGAVNAPFWLYAIIFSFLFVCLVGSICSIYEGTKK
jgi:hypothetical protein|nr:MAG TPA: hypothetical protein [Caudoviricetes sp.]